MDSKRTGLVKVRYRTARPEDIPEMVDLYLPSLTDLHKRFNIPHECTTQVRRAHSVWTYPLNGIFHVAEQRERIVAIAGAIVRDHLWFLSQFWAQPEIQGKNIEQTKDAVAVMTLAFREATAITPKVQIFVPGISHAALQIRLGLRFTVEGFAHFLTTSLFGHMENYLPSGPALC